MTQGQVAEVLHISLRSYASYELGERLPRTIEDYAKIASFYNVPLGFLYDEIRATQLETEGWFTKKSDELRWDLEAFCPQRNEWLKVNVKLFRTQSGSKILQRGTVFQTYGELTVNKIDKSSKVLLITNSQDFIRLATTTPPLNLPFEVSVRWLDIQAKVLGDYINLVK